jgi:hypothetical protein
VSAVTQDGDHLANRSLRGFVGPGLYFEWSKQDTRSHEPSYTLALTWCKCLGICLDIYGSDRASHWISFKESIFVTIAAEHFHKKKM